jgi:hypothetical protein
LLHRLLFLSKKLPNRLHSWQTVQRKIALSFFF